MDDPEVLVGTRDGLYTLDTAERVALAERSVTHLVSSAGDLWALVDGQSLLLNPRLDGGVAVGDLTAEHANCVLVGDDRVLIGTGHAALFELKDNEFHRSVSFDDAPGRSSWFTPWGGPPDVRSLARGVEGNIYANVHVGGVVRSQDRGHTWTDTMDIDADVHEVKADRDVAGRAFVASAIGLGITSDGGDSWSFTTAGLHGAYCRAVAVSDASVFVSASLGSGGRQAALYRGERAGGPLQRCTAGLPEWFSTNLDTFCLAARGDFVVAADTAGTVYVSRDDGAYWETAATSLPPINCIAIR